MLTRLQVSGFKNLLDVDVHFGPFTCIAGVNGAGKSNLFDAVQFLSALGDHTLIDAAQAVRAEGRRATDVNSLFFRAAGRSLAAMSFAVEMIVPGEAVDDLGQTARPSITFLEYRLALAKRQDAAHGPLGPLEVVTEELRQINLGEAYKHLPFPHRAASWRRSAVTGSRRVPFISTEGEGSRRLVKLHQDGGGGGPRGVPAQSLPRTVLSTANAAENPTALAARREMQSWRLLQLEPSHLREPDALGAPSSLATHGAHLAATLARLAGSAPRPGTAGSPVPATAPALALAPPPAPERSYARIADRLAELVEEVDDVWVDADEKRELLTLMVSSRDGATHAARALSDGTLRFLALAALAIDPRAEGLLCLEEPENGIHPARIPALLRLLQEIPTDVDRELGPDNPLRQVIVNTHSPAVVAQVPDASLLLAEPLAAPLRGAGSEGGDGGDGGGGREPARGVVFRCLAGTWRARQPGEPHVVSRGELMDGLNPVPHQPPPPRRGRGGGDRDGTQPLLPYA
jgi:predicted ATPase